MNIRSRWPRRIVGLAVFLSLALLPSVVRSNLEPLVGVVPLDPEVERIARFLERRAERTIDPQLRRQVASAVVEEARLAGLDPLYVLAVMEVESSFVPEAVSVANARGLLQLRDITIREISKHEELPAKAANEPEAIVHLRLGIRYLAMMHRKYGDPSRALAAWNAGPVAVDRALASSGEVPRRWLNFARRVQREHRNLQQIFGAEAIGALDERARSG